MTNQPDGNYYVVVKDLTSKVSPYLKDMNNMLANAFINPTIMSEYKLKYTCLFYLLKCGLLQISKSLLYICYRPLCTQAAKMFL